MNPQESISFSHGRAMCIFRHLVLACFLGCFPPASAQRQSWLPVTAADMALKDVPGNPGAPAVQIYYSQNIDDYKQGEEGEYIYRRIKILTEKGKKYADVEIKVPPDYRLIDLKARTIQPDGKIVDFTGKPFDKVIAKGKEFTYLAMSFTLADVKVGSTTEYW